MSTDLFRDALDAWWSQSDRGGHASADPGVDANRRLTGLAGAALMLPLAAVALSGLVFHWSPALHYFLGFAVLPLTTLKMASTGWRFANYYLLRRRAYRIAGPPSPLPRLLGPVVVASTVLVFFTGVILFFQGRDRGFGATLHTDSAVVFSLAVLLHGTIHLRSAADVTLAELRRRTPRGALLTGAAVAGVVVAVALVAGYHWALMPRLGRE